MKTIILGAVCAICLGACYNQRQAAEQTARAYRHYPALVAELARDKYPCITTSADSSGFLRSQRVTDSLLQKLNTISTGQEYEQGRLLTSIDRLKTDSITALHCKSLLTASAVFIKDQQQNADKLTTTIKVLRAAMRNQQPVVLRIEDSARIYLANKIATEATINYRVSQGLYEKEAAAHSKLQRKLRWAIIVPWWLCLLLAAGILFSWRQGWLRRLL